MKSDHLRILEVGMQFDPSRGGADRYFAGLVEHLVPSGHSVTAVAFGQPKATPPNSQLHQISLGSETAGFWARRKSLRDLRQTQKDSTDLLVTHFALYAWPLLGLAPHVVHFHGPWAAESAGEGQNSLKVALKRRLESQVYRNAQRIIVLSDAFGDLMKRDYRIPADRMVTIPGGIDLSRFHSEDRIAARYRLNWPAEGRIILCLRRLVPRMGIDTLIEAFATLASTHPDVILILGGRGSSAGALQKQSEALGLGNRIRFAGFLPDADLPAAYSAANVTIVPSRELEGFGLITLESMACGTPVLVTPVGGLPDTVRDLDPQLVLEGSDVATIARGLHRFLSQGELFPSSEQCRVHVEKHFAWPKIAARVAKVYEEVHDDSLC